MTSTTHYYLHNLHPDVVRITDGIAIHWYGLAYVIGFYLCYRVMLYLAKRGLSEIKPEQVADFITLSAIFGVVLGGRLGYMLLYDFDHFVQRPWLLFMINQGGMASHGGIAGLIFFCLWYSWRHKISWPGIGDTLVCGAPLGVFCGRLANFVNGELFGRVTTVPWAVKFPTELLHNDFVVQGGVVPPNFPPDLQHSPEIIEWFKTQPGGVDSLIAMLHPRHPSQLYEALGEGLFLSAILFTVRVRYPRLPHGILTGLFFILYAVARISLECVREPDSGAQGIMGLTRGQFFSLFMLVIGAAFIIYGWLKGPPPVKTAAETSVKVG